MQADQTDIYLGGAGGTGNIVFQFMSHIYFKTA